MIGLQGTFFHGKVLRTVSIPMGVVISHSEKLREAEG